MKPILPDLPEDMKVNRFDRITETLMGLPQEDLGRVLDAVTKLIGGVHSTLALLKHGEPPPPRYGLTEEEFAIFTLGSWLLPALAFLVAPPGEVEGDFKPWQPMQPAYLPPEMLALAMGGKKSGEVKVYMNDRYQAFVRTYADLDGSDYKVCHISVKQRDKGSLHDWRDFQRIKNDLLGPEGEAAELYPAESRLMDTSNQYHLWAFLDPEGKPCEINMGIHTGRLVSNVAGTGGRQRPFSPEDMPSGLMEESHPLDADGKINLDAVIRDLKASDQ